MATPASPRGRAYDSSGRRAVAQRNRWAVLEACRELLFRDGYRDTTVRAVAERAGVSVETVYKAFGSKPGLLKALWDVTLAGDDAPLPMAERPELQEVLDTADPVAKLDGYAGFVCGVHQRLAPLLTLLAQAGPEVAPLLEEVERERLAGLRAFVAHLDQLGALRDGADLEQLADSGWALTSPQLFTQLTGVRGWEPAAYRDWLADILARVLF
jgi:AcrR family transcriptional regulator